MGVVTNPLVLAGMSILEKLSYMAMHAGVALSPGIYQGMRRRSNKAKPIAVTPNGCDVEIFCPRFERTEARSESVEGLPEAGLRCVFTGAHGMANGVDAVLDAARRLLARGRRDIHLIFIGDGKLKPRLVERSRREGLSNCYFLDPMPKHRLAALMNEIDVA